MKKRGFTLMELLAVIVILAIIALIAVPIILNVIDETKKKAIKESANGYLDAVEKAIVLENIKEKNFNDGTYYIKNGDLYSDDNLETKVLDVKVKGDIPNGSDLNIEKGRITSCYLTISNYPVTCDANNISVGKKGEILARRLVINEKNVTISAEQTKQLTVTIYPENVTNKTITWTSSDKDVATIDENGVLTGVKNGTTTITAKTSNNIKATLTVSVEKAYEPGDTVKVDAIYNLFEENYKSNGVYTAELANGETIDFEMYNVSGNQTYTETPKLCNGTADSVMCIYKYNGDLTINSGVEIKPQVRKKGLVIYVEGTLTNNGEISMTARGAKATGQNVLLYKNSDSSYETVPKEGAAGGEAVKCVGTLDKWSQPGIKGYDGNSRQTGGGGSGASAYNKYSSGAGSKGTSYSGGTGGGGNECTSRNGGSGTANGGAGGRGCANNSSQNELGGGGAGNPGGYGYGGANYSSDNVNTTYDGGWALKTTALGSSGTGGLLVIYANDLLNNNTINSNGSNGGAGRYGGGSSGGGSINIFYKKNITLGNISITGGIETGTIKTGGAGGSGTKTVCSIATGTCVK